MSVGPATADIAARPQAPRTVLRITGLSKTFPGTKALDDVTLEVAEGEIHALVGQNGSGKSTLIKVLAGYHHADPGAQAWLNEEPFDVHDTTDSRHHRLRFVHQDLGLFLELGATDNLALRGQFLLDPLRADAEELDVAAFALRAPGARLTDQSTIMTAQVLLRQMIRQRDTAPFTGLRIAAVLTFDERCKPPPVL